MIQVFKESDIVKDNHYYIVVIERFRHMLPSEQNYHIVIEGADLYDDYNRFMKQIFFETEVYSITEDERVGMLVMAELI